MIANILPSDTLETGFRTKTNNAFDEIINDDPFIESGLIKFPKHGGGYWTLDLGTDYFNKDEVIGQIQPLDLYATESVVGRVQRASYDEGVAGVNTTKYTSPALVKEIIRNTNNLIDNYTIGVHNFEFGEARLMTSDNMEVGIGAYNASDVRTSYLNTTSGGWKFLSEQNAFTANLDFSNLTSNINIDLKNLATTASSGSWNLNGNIVTSEKSFGTLDDYNIPIIQNGNTVAVFNAKGASFPAIQEGESFEGARDFVFAGIDLAAPTKQLIKVTNAQATGYLSNYLWKVGGNTLSSSQVMGSVSGSDFDIPIHRNGVEVGKWITGGLKVPLLNVSDLTASQLVATDASKNLQSLSTATYPSLTEISYVKGVTSSIQTQINGKFQTPTGLTTNYHTKWNGSALDNSLLFDNGSGVGLGTSSPIQVFHIRKDSSSIVSSSTITGSNLAGIAISNLNATLGAGASLAFQLGATGTSWAAMGAIRTTANNSALVFYTELEDVFTEKLRINPNGDVGIGKTPAYKLDVNGTGHFTGNAIFDGNVGIGTTSPAYKTEIAGGGGYWTGSSWTSTPLALAISNTQAGGYDPVLVFQQADSGGVTKIAGGIGLVGTAPWTAGNNSTQTSDMYFVVRNDSGGVSERMRIKSTGNVGIGTTSPTQKLEVNGNIKATGLMIPTSAAVGYTWKCTDATTGAGTWQSVSIGERWKGVWAANSGSAPSASPTEGDYYTVITAGTYSGVTYAVNDYSYYTGSAWVYRPNGYILTPATTGGIGGVVIGTTMEVNGFGVINQKSGIITPGDYSKITVDTYGRVTAGFSLSASDIPSLDASKITSGTFLDARIASAATWNAKQAALVSGTNIKTVGLNSLLGSGDVSLASLNYWTKTGSNLSYTGGYTKVDELQVNAFKILSTGLTTNSWFITNDNTSGNLSFSISDVNDEFGTPFSFYADVTTGLIDLQLPVDVSIGRLKDSYGSFATANKVYMGETGGIGKWTTLTTDHISNLSSYTGFDARYYTETESDLRFVDFDTDQNINGIKTFSNHINIGGFTLGESLYSISGVSRTLAKIWHSNGIVINGGSRGIHISYDDIVHTSIKDTGILIGSGLNKATFATEKLQVNGNIRYSGVLKPSNTAGTNGQVLSTNGTNDSWTTLTTSHISNISDYLTVATFTEKVPIDLGQVHPYKLLGNVTTDIADVQQLGVADLFTIMGQATNNHGDVLIVNGGVAKWARLEIDPQGLSEGKIGVGDSQNYLSELTNFEFLNKQYLSISRIGDYDKKINIGVNMADNNSFLTGVGGYMNISATYGLKLPNYVGSGTRYLTIGADGTVGTTTSTGGAIQTLDDVLGVGNTGIDKNIKIKTSTSNGYELWNNSDFYRGGLLLDVVTDTVSLIASKLNIETGSGKIIIDAQDGSDIEISKAVAGSFIVLNGTKFSFHEDLLYQGSNTWGSGNNQATPQEGDIINFRFSGGKFVMNKI